MISTEPSPPATTFKVLHTIPHHMNYVFGISSSPDGRFVFSGGLDKSIISTDIASGEIVAKSADAHRFQVRKIAVAPNGKFVVSCDYNEKVVKVWDSVNLKLMCCLEGSDSEINRIAVSHDSKTIVCGDIRGGVKLWTTQGEPETWALSEKSWKDHNKIVEAVTFR